MSALSAVGSIPSVSYGLLMLRQSIRAAFPPVGRKLPLHHRPHKPPHNPHNPPHNPPHQPPHKPPHKPPSEPPHKPPSEPPHKLRSQPPPRRLPCGAAHRWRQPWRS